MKERQMAEKMAEKMGETTGLMMAETKD